jgi:NAD(P)-dependent dehydrogenase (short-subunit alcohol dehydrogenase family)
MNRFQDQVAIVSGGARGIGRSIALRLAREGATVVVFDVLGKELEKTIQMALAEGLAVQGRLLDVREADLVEQETQGVYELHQRLDVLVNSAGVVGQTATKIVDYDNGVFEHLLDVNLKGAFYLTKYALPFMLKARYGRILHIASIAGKEGNPGMMGYSVSKAGLLGLVKAAGKEYADQGITVNGLAPAVIATEMNRDTDPEMLAYMTAKIPMGRLGTVEEAAALSCWIVSPEASFNTGVVFDLSGGRATY